MTRAFVSALLAAAALLPAVAQAQEPRIEDRRSDRPGRENGGGNREQHQRQFDNGGQGRPQPQDGGQRFTPAPQPQQAPQPQVQTPQQRAPQPQFQGRPQFQGQPQQPPQFQGQPRERQPRFGGQPGERDPGRPGWNNRGPNGNGGFTPAPPPGGGPAGRPQPGFNGRQPGGAPLWDGNRYDRGPGWNAQPPRNNGAWNRQWRGDQRYDWQRFRNDNRGSFRLPRYYAPRGWGYGYRRFGIGITLNSLLFAPDYWIDDPYEYRLPPAYGPYRWVRYYNDALLVDIRSGLVVDTIYDIFW